MKKLSFIIALVSLFSLFVLYLFLPIKTISSPAELSALVQNQKIIIQGNVIKETYSNNYKILTLNSELQLKCDINCPNYLNENISALAILEKYNNNNYLNVIKIRTLE